MSVTKLCNKCGQEKSLEQFHNSRTHRDRHMNFCKTCTHEKQRIKRSEDKIRELKGDHPSLNWVIPSSITPYQSD